MAGIGGRGRRWAVVAGLVAVLLAGCGSGVGAGTDAPASGEQDLMNALPAPQRAPTVPVSPAPPSSAGRVEATPGTPPVAGSSPVAGDPTDAGRGPQWRQVAGDDFDGDRLNTDRWWRYHSVGGFGNGLRRPQAVTQTDGLLRITARGEVSGGMRHARDQLYGRWEFRARTDPGRGFGSAILLWPKSERWPDDGEIDIMEVPGERRDLAHFVLHMGPENRLHGGNVPGDYTQWHTFAVEWLPDRITWYVDGVPQYENTDPAMIPRKPMHLAVQLDQGPWEDWLMAPDATTPAELSLEVDWVRVYAPADD